MNKKTILITGINGFLGSHLAKKFQEEFKIIGLTNNPQTAFRLKGLDFELYTSDDESLNKIFRSHKIFAIIHTATVYRKDPGSTQRLFNSNLALPIRLYELGNESGVDLFLNTDSFFNHSGTKYSYLSEYTLSKKHALEWLQTIRDKCTLINMKLFHMYGPNDSTSKFVNGIITKISSHIDHIDLTEGNQERDFIYIDDVIRAYKTVLNEIPTKSPGYHEFEVGTGKSVSIKDFVKEIKAIIKSPTELRFGALPQRENEIMNLTADNSNLVNLGWKPQLDYRQGLKKTILNG